MRRTLSNLGFRNAHTVQFDSLCEEESSPPRDPLALRRSLQNRFDAECPYSLTSLSSHSTNMSHAEASLPSLTSLNLNFHPNPKRILRSSANKLTKSFGNLRTTIEEFSQKFRASTRRRSRLSDSPVSPNTPYSRTRKILGRTPTKLYSPFAIVTPSPSTRKNLRNKENFSTPRRNTGRTPQRKKLDKMSAKKSESQLVENKSACQVSALKSNERHI